MLKHWKEIGSSVTFIVVILVIFHFNNNNPKIPFNVDFERPELCAQQVLEAIRNWEENPLEEAHEIFGNGVANATYENIYWKLESGQAGFNYHFDHDSEGNRFDLELIIDPRYSEGDFQEEIEQIFVVKEGGYVGFLSDYIDFADIYAKASSVDYPSPEIAFIQVFNNNNADNEFVLLIDAAAYACAVITAANIALEESGQLGTPYSQAVFESGSFGIYIENDLFIRPGNPKTFSEIVGSLEVDSLVIQDKEGYYQLAVNPADPYLIEAMVAGFFATNEDSGLTEFLGLD
jgi:hypothetical protein